MGLDVIGSLAHTRAGEGFHFREVSSTLSGVYVNVCGVCVCERVCVSEVKLYMQERNMNRVFIPGTRVTPSHSKGTNKN